MAQRITNSMMISSYNRNLNANQKRMSTLQDQLATNKKLVRLSDDPVSVVKVLNSKSKLNDIEQYQKNLRDANAWLTHTETALGEMNEVIKRTYELAVYASNDVLEPDDRQAIAEEVQQLRDQVITLANTTLGDKYIFGSYNVSSAPFMPDPETGDVLLNGTSMVFDDGDEEFIRYEINLGIDFDVAVPGNALLGVGEQNNIYFQINEFLNTIQNPESTLNEIQPFIGSMQNLQKSVLATMAEVGGRTSRLEMMETRFAQDNINYTQMKSDVEDLDTAEAVMKFSMAEAVYRAALGVGGRILQPTLVDFLK